MSDSEVTKGVSRDLLLNFFLEFSRFEYALKASGYFKTWKDKGVRIPEPDWKKFMEEIREKFKSDENDELKEACDYIQKHPPDRQIVDNGSFMWETQYKDPDMPEVDDLLEKIKRIRNNLFHGTKFNKRTHQTPERTSHLLKCAIVILKAWLEVSPKVKEKYADAVI